MTVTDLLKTIKELIRKQKAAIANDMVEGRMTDFSAYHKNVGVAEGLEQACEIIDDMMKKLNEGDD
jgi:hypothetical protein|tara:strand:+ start:513 stop:710 length:198 start_codon:yes stop_codon:yes gene_type:complete